MRKLISLLFILSSIATTANSQVEINVVGFDIRSDVIETIDGTHDAFEIFFSGSRLKLDLQLYNSADCDFIFYGNRYKDYFELSYLLNDEIETIDMYINKSFFPDGYIVHSGKTYEVQIFSPFLNLGKLFRVNKVALRYMREDDEGRRCIAEYKFE